MMNRPPRSLHAFSSPVVKRCALVFFAGASALAAVVALLYFQDRRHEQTIVRQEGAHWAELESEILSQEFKSVQADLLYLAKQEQLLAGLSDDAAAREGLERDYVRFCQRKEVYDQIRCLDLAGREVVRVNYRGGSPEVVPREQLQLKADRYYFKQALPLADGVTFVSPFDLNVEHGVIQRPLKPVIRFLTPVYDRAGNKRGLVVLNYLGQRLLNKLAEVSAGVRGSIYLLNPTGEYLLSPQPADAWGWLLGHNRSFPVQFAEEWKRIGTSDQIQFHTERGHFTCRRIKTPGAEAPSTQSADQLVLVLHVTDELVFARSGKLLRQLLLMYVGACGLLLGISWYWAYLSAIRKQNEQRISHSETRLRKLSGELLSAQEDERRRISRELHDQLGQEVTSISLDLQSAAKQDDPAQTRTLLDRAIRNTDQVLNDLHQIATRVRPSVLDDLGLEDAVTSFVADYQQRTEIEVATEMVFRDSTLPRRVAENTYRILQEALTNIAKHGRANQVWIKIDVDADRLCLIVRDEGVGFSMDNRDTSRLGILGMQERAELLGGTFQLTTAPNQGTRIEVAIPLADGVEPEPVPDEKC